MVLLVSAAGLVAVVGIRVTGVGAAGVLLLLLLPGPGAAGRVMFAPVPALGLLEAMAGGGQLSKQRSSQEIKEVLNDEVAEGPGLARRMRTREGSRE